VTGAVFTDDVVVAAGGVETGVLEGSVEWTAEMGLRDLVDLVEREGWEEGRRDWDKGLVGKREAAVFVRAIGLEF
jgi:hypothetical protein